MRQRPTGGPLEARSIAAILRCRAETDPHGLALLAPGRQSLSWADLSSQCDYIAGVLADIGATSSDRIAIALPDGPDLAAAFLSISGLAAFAPLNPAYRKEDFEFYLTDLKPKALILPEGHDTPARDVAGRLRIEILDLRSPSTALAGQFELVGKPRPISPNDGRPLNDAGENDAALVLHTSGTTSRPKMVLLSQCNLCNSAYHIGETLRLGSSDRGLCIVPLFHVHGLLASLLSSVAAGAAVICSSGFSAPNFFQWLKEFQPTWYSAVPTMHQAILSHAPDYMPVIERVPLRFIRSCSSALPPQVMRRLEEVFGAPVIEAYGMTEAAHQIASNSLPPGVRKPGSVGRAAGPELAIMSGSGHLLTAGQTGEIIIRGPNVTTGYANNPGANATAFTAGWFRTGDQGYLDSDGFLFITGRLKEMINRGGEKIAPREIDEALLNHPAVAQAVAFPVPHSTLGEDVVAAVVLKPDGSCTEAELREFVFGRLAGFKIPSRIILVDSIPKGPTGKIQRIGLATRLTMALSVAYESSETKTEELICSTVGNVLELPKVGRHDNFFAVGGDSLRAVQVSSRLSQQLGIELPAFLLFRYPTASLLGVELDRQLAELDVTKLAAILEELSPEDVDQLLDDSEAQPV